MDGLTIFFKQFVRMFFLSLLILCFPGCMGGLSKPPQTFLLNNWGQPLPDQMVVRYGFEDQSAPKIGIGPVKIPEYLNRPQIVSRLKGNEIYFDEFHLWAEPLKESFARVLAKNLSCLLATDHVFIFPWFGVVKPEYRLTVDVFRFDGKHGEEVYLDVLWAVYHGDNNLLLKSNRSALKETCPDNSYQALVDAHNLLILRLSVEIADAVKSFSFSSSNP